MRRSPGKQEQILLGIFKLIPSPLSIGIKIVLPGRQEGHLCQFVSNFQENQRKARRPLGSASSQMLHLGKSIFVLNEVSWGGLFYPSPCRLPQISCFTLSLECFSSDSENCLDVRIGPLLQQSHPPWTGPVLLTLLVFPLVPSSYRVLYGSIYSFPLARQSCPLSAGVLHALLCLKVQS